jgi:hypothetical protein
MKTHIGRCRCRVSLFIECGIADREREKQNKMTLARKTQRINYRFLFFQIKFQEKFSYLVDNRLSEGAAPDGPLLLFDRIAVTTTGFSFSISPLTRRESVRCASVYS